MKCPQIVFALLSTLSINSSLKLTPRCDRTKGYSNIKQSGEFDKRASRVFSSVSSVAQSCPTLCDPMNRSTQASLSITNSRSSLRLMSIESVMPSSHLILGRPLLLLPPIPPSIRVFSNESTLRMRWPKYWSFSFSISPSKENPGLISFRMDWLDLLAVQGTRVFRVGQRRWRKCIYFQVLES